MLSDCRIARSWRNEYDITYMIFTRIMGSVLVICDALTSRNGNPERITYGNALCNAYK